MSVLYEGEVGNENYSFREARATPHGYCLIRDVTLCVCFPRVMHVSCFLFFVLNVSKIRRSDSVDKIKYTQFACAMFGVSRVSSFTGE